MDYSTQLIAIAENLNRIPRISKSDDPQEREADRLTHGLLDIQETPEEIRKINSRLADTHISEEDIEDILTDIGMKFRHILYHIHDNKSYSYLWEEYR